MEEYLIDRETLGQFIDELIKKKPLPVNTAEELNSLREQSMKDLDEKISMAVFGSLTDSQLDEINTMLDNPNVTAEEFQEFFKNAGVDIEQTIAEAMRQYSTEFLGGQNA